MKVRDGFELHILCWLLIVKPAAMAIMGLDAGKNIVVYQRV